MIIGERMATLHELSTVYSLEDALNIAEVIQVRHYNEFVAMKDSEAKANKSWRR